MKRETTSKRSFSAEDIALAIERAPARVDDPDSPYDPNNPESVRAYWADAKVHMPSDWLVAAQLSGDVVSYFKNTGGNWEARIDAVLREWIRQQSDAKC